MTKILHITNGDNTVHLMQAAELPGTFLPWRDVLHEGPVPSGLELEALSTLRAQFLTGRDWGDARRLAKDFQRRDAHLQGWYAHDKIILWFEHDLYDQLQILQILDWFHRHRVLGKIELTIICTDQYLGMLSPQAINGLMVHEETVTEQHLELATAYWSAFRSQSPDQLEALLDADSTPLPFVAGAVERLLEEYPSTANGLSRTEQQALSIIHGGEQCFGRVFEANQQMEERMFMGDLSFQTMLHNFIRSNPPLLTLSTGTEITLPVDSAQRLTITATGRDVLESRTNWLDTVAIDRWLGGVHLTPATTWCWNPISRSLVRRHAA